MPAFALKPYQQQALDALTSYLRVARLQGAGAAYFSETGYGYQSQPFGEVPCVCLRIPTGGGKTLRAAHAVGLVARRFAVVYASDDARSMAQQLDDALR